MNNLQPYENHLADKLHQVPVPDKDEGWIEMRKLLDRDMPEGGGGWSGNRKWWWMGLTVAIIIAGLWGSQQFNDKQQLASEQTNNNTNLSSTVDATSRKANDEIKTSQSNQSSAETKSNTALVESIKTNKQASVENKSSNTNNDAQIVKQKSPSNEVINDPNEEVVYNTGKNIKATDPPTISITAVNHPSKSGSKKLTTVANKGNKQSAVLAAGSAGVLMMDKQRNADGDLSESPKPNEPRKDMADASEKSSKTYKSPEENAFISSFIIPSQLSNHYFENPEETFGNIPNASQPLRAEPGKTDKAFAKEMRKKSIQEDNRKMSKRSMKGIGMEKERDLTIALGLSLPQSFAIGTQQSPAYGVNAKPGKASDYIPVPFFQYHLNNKIFLQTELQFQTPQFTDRLLISQSQLAIAPTNGMLEKNVYVDKLYYFHIPVNIYFSPIRNVYFGSGIQYSSLLSGVATYQENRYTNGSLEKSNSRVQGFKDDSIAAKLTPNEWRYQFEGNYYFKRFTFGARYNQALKQFINLQPAPGLPPTQGRNQSFLIYLRYNILEQRKKDSYYANSW